MIELKNISKSFGKSKVLDNVSLTIHEGERLCIIGKSGCGKSVLLKHIVGLLQPDGGEVWIDGTNVTNFLDEQWYEILPRFGVVFQGSALFDSLTVGENVGMTLYEEKQMEAENILSEVSSALQKVALKDDILNLKPASLSGGMKKRVSIARALIHKPNYLLYDEPTTGLDPIVSERIDDLIEQLSHLKGTTSVVVTHDLFTVQKIATRVVMIDNRKICFEGTVTELEKSENETVKDFIKRSPL